ncbi:hypothetical protein L6R53_22230 [Myxococcota bacterium]|nr:hypothetical protein [Myxococcota bacterium]
MTDRTLRACMVGWMLWAPTARAATQDPVVESLPDGRIDWSRLVLEAQAQSDLRVGAWMDRRVQEQDALDRLGPRVERLAQRVRVTPDTLAIDLMSADGDLPRRLEDTVDDWRVVETRYHDGGTVEMLAELDLQRWLRPALRSLAAQEAPPAGPGERTGLVVDARGLPFEPCLAPRVTGPTGTVLFGAQRLTEAAFELAAPVVYVTDPADTRAAERAGDHPHLVRAVSVVGGGELVLDPATARRLEVDPDLPTIAARGRVVVVVGP